VSQRVVKEDDYEEIESVERPAEKAGEEGVAGAGVLLGVRRISKYTTPPRFVC